MSVSFVRLRCGFAGTVIDAPGVAAIGELPLAASNQPEVTAPRWTRIRPVTPGTAFGPQPARPWLIVTRVTGVAPSGASSVASLAPKMFCARWGTCAVTASDAVGSRDGVATVRELVAASA